MELPGRKWAGTLAQPGLSKTKIKMAGKAIGSPRKNLWGGMREAGEEPKRPRVSARAQGHESPCAREEDGPV